jgi:hypothetical protein
MSCDSTDDEYHLTLNGWVVGTHYCYSQAIKTITRPVDTVETWIRKMQQSSSYAPEVITWELNWASPDYSESERTEIEKKYPRPKYQ